MAETLSSSPGPASPLDALIDAYVCLDHDFRYTFVNRASEQLLGTSRADLLGKTLWEVYPDLGGTNFESSYRRAMGERICVAFEDYYAPWKRWYAITVLPDSGDGIMVRTIDITERKLDEHRVAAIREEFDRFFALIPDLAAVVSTDGFFKKLNPAWEATLGFSIDELLSQPFENFVHPDDVATTRQEVCRQLDGRGTLQFVNRYRTKSDEYRWLEWVATPAVDGSSLYATARDITERKRAEEALRTSEANFRDLFDSAPVAYHELDRDGVIRQVNRAECALLGYGADDMLGRPVWEFIFEPDREAGRELLARKLSGEQLLEPFHRRFVRRDGRELCLEIHDKLVRNAAGEATGIRSAMLDITERQRAEEALRDSEEKFRSITEQTSDLIALADIHGFITYASSASSALFLVSPDEMCGHHFTKYLDESAIPKATAAFRLALETGERTKDLELKMRRADGSLFVGELNGLSFRRNEQNATLVVIRDVTDRNQTAMELERASQTVSLALVAGKAGAWELNPETGALLWTEEYRQLLNVDPSFVPTLEAFLALVHPDDREMVAAEIQKSIDERARSFQNQFRIVLADGIHWMERTGIVQYDAAGNAVRMIGITSDITGRKRAEEDLRASEERYRNLVAALPGTVYTFRLDSAGRRSMPFISQQITALSGLSATEIMDDAERAFAVVPTQARPPFEKSITESQLNLSPWLQEFPIQTVDGRQKWVRGHALPRREPDGATVWNGVFIDITPQKRAEDALRQSEEGYRSLFENMVEGFAYCRVLFEDGRPRDFVYLVINKAFETLTGLRDVIGKKVSEVIPGIREADPDLLERYGRVAMTGRSERFEFYVTAMNMWFDLSIYSPKKGDFVAVFDVITERKRAEDALLQANLRLNMAVASGRLGTWEWDLQSGALVWDDRMFELYGVVRGQFGVCYEAWRDVVHSDDRAKALEAIEAAMRDERQYDLEFRVVHPDGAVRHIKADGLVVRDAGGRAVRMVGLNRDITETKRAVEEREQLQAQLVQAQKMESIGRLAGGVAHDFNNLLTVINGYSRMALAALRAGDPLRDSIEEIYKAGERAAGLTRQLLAFSRKQILEPRRLNVNRVVTEMQPMVERLVGEDIQVHVVLHAASGTIHADPHQLEQVVMNLVVNARDAMPGVGKLMIETANVERDGTHAGLHPEVHAGGYVMLAVSDTGVGMDEETKHRIFEPFFTTKAIGKGTGLGLSMVQGIVAQSGGYVEVYSEKGTGTTFKVYLPALAEAATAGLPESAVPVIGGKETVLVVEDQAEVRKYTVAVLERYGYRVIPAVNASEALLLCEQEHIDLLLTDVIMPNLSGPELAERLEKLQAGMRVLFMSGYTDDAIVHHGVLGEGVHFIQKPFSPEGLAVKVRSVLALPGPLARILVADDEAGVRTFLRKVLEDGGYNVIEAADGRQALTLARAGHVNLVITDLVMPEQEGIETIQALRRDLPNVEIIAMSGAFGSQFLKIAQLLGAAVVLNKPVSAELLLAKVAEVLKTRR